MLRAAVFRAEQVIPAGFGRAEPERDVAPGNDVGLDAECRDEHVVNHVLGGRNQTDVPADRNVQLVDLPLAVEMLELPHPLLADDVDVQGVVGGMGHREEHAGAPAEDDHRDEQRDHGPRDFEQQAAVNRYADGLGLAAVELDGEEDDEPRDEHREETRNAEQEEVKRVHALRDGRGGFGEEGDAEPHDQDDRRSRRTMTTTNALSNATVRAPATRSARMIWRP